MKSWLKRCVFNLDLNRESVSVIRGVCISSINIATTVDG